MSEDEKAKKFDEIQELLWSFVYGGNMLQQMLAANIIRLAAIPGPDGEDPESV